MSAQSVQFTLFKGRQNITKKIRFSLKFSWGFSEDCCVATSIWSWRFGDEAINSDRTLYRRTGTVSLETQMKTQFLKREFQPGSVISSRGQRNRLERTNCVETSLHRSSSFPRTKKTTLARKSRRHSTACVRATRSLSVGNFLLKLRKRVRATRGEIKIKIRIFFQLSNSRLKLEFRE